MNVVRAGAKRLDYKRVYPGGVRWETDPWAWVDGVKVIEKCCGGHWTMTGPALLALARIK